MQKASKDTISACKYRAIAQRHLGESLRLRPTHGAGQADPRRMQLVWAKRETKGFRDDEPESREAAGNDSEPLFVTSAQIDFVQV